MNKIIGVGNIEGYDDIQNKVQIHTTRDDAGDFNVIRARTFAPIGDAPVVLIVKKNVSVLENILLWIMRDAAPSFDKNTSWDWSERLFQDIKAMSIDGNSLKTYAPKVKNKPLLLIDDECDQASVDTNPDHSVISGEEANPEHDPTKQISL